MEIWSPQREAGIEEFKLIGWWREHPFEDDLKMLKWSDETLEGKAFVDWYPFKHPQLGDIELGGWDMFYAFRNPPPHLLEREISKFPKWLVWHCLISPKLELDRLEAQSLGGGAYLVRLVVSNTGWLPTYVTKQALDRKAAREVVVEIELPEGATLETGKLREEVGQLEGRAYKNVSPYGGAADATDERLKAQWVLRAKPGQTVRVTARHDRAGFVRAEVVLE